MLKYLSLALLSFSLFGETLLPLANLNKDLQTVVVCGHDAPDREKDLAREIAYDISAHRTIDDCCYNDIYVQKHLLQFFANCQLVIVGSPKTNLFCQQKQVEQVFHKLKKDEGHILLGENPAVGLYQSFTPKIAEYPQRRALFILGKTQLALEKANISMQQKNILSGKTSDAGLPQWFNKEFLVPVTNGEHHIIGCYQATSAEISQIHKCTKLDIKSIQHLLFSTVDGFFPKQPQLKIISLKSSDNILEAVQKITGLKGIDSKEKGSLVLYSSKDKPGFSALSYKNSLILNSGQKKWHTAFMQVCQKMINRKKD